jgi:hypothetical protein
MAASEPAKRPTLNAIRLYRCERHSSANQAPRLHARTRSPADPGNADGLNRYQRSQVRVGKAVFWFFFQQFKGYVFIAVKSSNSEEQSKDGLLAERWDVIQDEATKDESK